ncbi:MAG TPA: hypothetical protein VE974_02730 [Thermoanaerobaculia bacterium]|nr:hypothetical protein [Thermoanaerobaculia bacterium]
MRRSLRTSSLVVLSLALSLPAMAYTVVNTSAPSIHCVYNPSCTMSGTDLISTMANGGKIVSRYYQGQAGSPAAGKWVYRYRIDMTNAVGALSLPYVSLLSIPNWGTVLSYDYNFDTVATDEVFVVTSGGLGTVGLSNAGIIYGITFFNPVDNVYGGSSPGTGESSYFFGLISPYPPEMRNAVVHTESGSVNVSVYAPNLP